MTPAPLPRFEARRQQAVDALGPLHDENAGQLGRIVRMAQRWFGARSCAVSLSDGARQRFVACAGASMRDLPREIALCAHVVAGREPLVVPDTRLDARFHDNPCVTEAPFLRFYAAVPLFSHVGQALGTLCVLDDLPRRFGEADRQSLQDHALLAQAELDRLRLERRDRLTGLPAAEAFEREARRALSALPAGCVAMLALFDLAGMKDINAHFGRHAGDRAVSSFAAALSEGFRGEPALMGRLAGDRFVALLIGAQAPQGLDRALRGMHAAVDRLNESPLQSYELRVGVAVAPVPVDRGGDALRRALASADEQLCVHKRHSMLPPAFAAWNREAEDEGEGEDRRTDRAHTVENP